MKKNVISAMALGMAIMSTPVMAFAAESTELVNPTAGNTKVQLVVEADYTVSLPAQVNLEYAADGLVAGKPVFQADYQVKTDGTLPAEQSLQITCKDVTLTNAGKDVVVENGFNAETGKAGVKTVKIASASIAAHSEAGHMETDAHGITSGTYTGTADFSYKLVK